MVSDRLRPFGTTIFSEMTRLAIEHQAINLSQGFPDFEGPPEIIDAAVEAMRAGHNQYARSMGTVPLVEAIAEQRRELYDLSYDPMSEVVVFSGATEGLMSSMLGLLNPGDEVILFEPFYDSYPACVAMAGAIPRYLTLRFPDFAVDRDELEAVVNEKTRLIVLNTPHNPTGKVFGASELSAIAEVAVRNDLIVLTDEVYEHLTYDDTPHIPIATLPGMKERTLSLSSTGKTYSFTGWKVGWGTGPQRLVAAAQAAHQFVTFATATPLQMAVAEAIRGYRRSYFTDLRHAYTARRDLLVEILRSAGFRVAVPEGAYFVLADFAELFEGDDVGFVKHLVTEHGVAAIPPSYFYDRDPLEGKRLVRFAFCKRISTLEDARPRLKGLSPLQ